jgi:peptidoglycan/xylan/chitin deacetylase (PgdA/CDA1 family)
LSDTLVLCYHAVSPSWPADLSITPERLEWQLELLVRRGYEGRTFTEAAAGRGGRKVVSVTFDDSYRSVIELAFPILSRLGLPGTVFVPTRFAGSEAPMSWAGIGQWLAGPHERELMPMSWEELAQLAEGGWEIGSHTRSHPRLTQVGDDDLAAELDESKKECERRLGRPCESIAYPYGDHDDRVVAAARRAGYVAAGTLPSRFDARDPLRFHRVGVYYGDDERRFRLKVSRPLRMLRGSRAWEAAQRAPAIARRG